MLSSYILRYYLTNMIFLSFPHTPPPHPPQFLAALKDVLEAKKYSDTTKFFFGEDAVIKLPLSL